MERQKKGRDNEDKVKKQLLLQKEGKRKKEAEEERGKQNKGKLRKKKIQGGMESGEEEQNGNKGKCANCRREERKEYLQRRKKEGQRTDEKKRWEAMRERRDGMK